MCDHFLQNQVKVMKNNEKKFGGGGWGEGGGKHIYESEMFAMNMVEILSPAYKETEQRCFFLGKFPIFLHVIYSPHGT